MKPSVTKSACTCFSVRRCLRDFPASVFSQPASFSAKGSSLLGRSGVANFGSTAPAARCLVTVFRDSPVRRAISRIDSFCRKCMRRMMFKSPMWITPLPPPLSAQGEGSHGSILSGSYATSRLSSRWKSTSLPSADWLLADRGYDADWFREALKDKGIKPCIPGRKSRGKPIKHDKRRNRIEIMFGRLKDWRRVATPIRQVPEGLPLGDRLGRNRNVLAITRERVLTLDDELRRGQ